MVFGRDKRGMDENRSGQFESVLLKPIVVISKPEKSDLARVLHHEAGKNCFISNSCNFPVKHEPVISIS